MTLSGRLIPYLTASGAWQMALDDWLLQVYGPQFQRPVLRFYGWAPTAVSLGYFQAEYPEFWRRLTWRGEKIDLLRRSSGGRAVLHQGTLTYSLVLPLQGRSRRQCYRQICQFLIQGWRRLGIELQPGGEEGDYRLQTSCFNSATPADLVMPGDGKLIGSAQRRQGGWLLQHGSMILNTDKKLYEQVFQQPAPWGRGLNEGVRVYTVEEIVATLTATAQDCLGLEFLPEPLGAEEINGFPDGASGVGSAAPLSRRRN
jgi:lipoate-protein ligase A